MDNAPVILIARGQYQHAAIRRTRVSLQSLEQQLRSQGITDINKVQFAILESGGTVSILSGDSEQVWPTTLPQRQG